MLGTKKIKTILCYHINNTLAVDDLTTDKRFEIKSILD